MFSLRGSSVVEGMMHLIDNELLVLSKKIPFMFYGGSISSSSPVFSSFPIITDDRPVIEFQSPQNARKVNRGIANYLTGESYVKLLREIQEISPLDSDEYLSKLSKNEKDYVSAGSDYLDFALHSRLFESSGKESEDDLARDYFQQFITKMDISPATFSIGQ